MGPDWKSALGDHSLWCLTGEPSHRSSEVIEVVDKYYMQPGDDYKLQAAQQSLRYRSSLLRRGHWEYSGLLKGTCSRTRVAHVCYSPQSSAGHKYGIVAPLAFGRSSEQQSPIWNEDREECL